MLSVPAYVIDALNGLLDAELSCAFRFIDSTSPYLSRATAEIRGPLVEMGQAAKRHARELADLIYSLGGAAAPRLGPAAEDQYAAYLSLKFLLPKLVIDKQLVLQRYENAKGAIGDEFSEVMAVLDRISGEHRHYLDILLKAAHEVTGGKFVAVEDPSGPVHAGPKNSDGGPSVD